VPRMGAKMRIRIVPYQQLVDQDKNARGVFAKKWEVSVECDSLEEAEKLKETLAQPKQEPVAWMREDEDCTDCIVWEQTEEHTIPLYTTPPQRKSEQEPVVWRSWNEKDGFGFWDTKHEAESWCDPDFDSEPLYTIPPQREWVGLTDEEKHDCYLRIDVWSRCVEMVENKLREKNG